MKILRWVVLAIVLVGLGLLPASVPAEALEARVAVAQSAVATGECWQIGVAEGVPCTEERDCFPSRGVDRGCGRSLLDPGFCADEDPPPYSGEHCVEYLKCTAGHCREILYSCSTCGAVRRFRAK